MNKTDLNMTWHGRFFSPFRIIIINEILRKICESATCTDNSGAATPLVMKSSGICSKIIYIYIYIIVLTLLIQEKNGFYSLTLNAIFV